MLMLLLLGLLVVVAQLLQEVIQKDNRLASKNSPSEEFSVPRLLREFGSETFGTMKAFAEALGMTAPALQGYLNGTRTPGRRVLAKLADLGFDLRKLEDSPNGEYRGLVKSFKRPDEMPTTESVPPLALELAQLILRIPLETISSQVEATPQMIGNWINGREAPSHRQLGLLFNLVVVAGIASRPSDLATMISQPASTPASEERAA